MHAQSVTIGRVALYKGNLMVTCGDSKNYSLFDPTVAIFKDDAAGFIKLNAVPMRIAANLVSHKKG